MRRILPLLVSVVTLTTVSSASALPPRAAPLPRLNVQGPASLPVAPMGASPDTCAPEDIPFRFSAGNWVAPSYPGEFYEKLPDGCQSVWLTSGKAVTFILYYYEGEKLRSVRKECPAGPVCQLWNPATNYELFYIDDFSNIPTSVNIYF